MKLTKELKQKIDAYFESKSAEEVYEILKGYGLKVSEKEIKECELQGNVNKIVKKVYKSKMIIGEWKIKEF